MVKRIALMVAVMAWLVTAPSLRAQDAAHTAHDVAATAAKIPQESAHAVEAGAASAHGEGHGGHDKPPLIPDPGNRETQLQALWVVIIFVILLIILYPTAWRNVLNGLKKREERIRKDIADAEAARAKAEATLKEFNARLATAEARSQEMIAKAVTEGERLATSIKLSAQQEAEEAKERATRDIEASKNQAIAEIREQAVYLATNVAEKIIRKNLNPEDQRALVRQSLEQLQGIGRG